jgi:prevent-host-death family protein
MQTVIGVRSLKAGLSACLRRVRAGERITVTDRGRPIAAIVPIDAGPAREWIDRMVAEGRAYWSGGKPAGMQRPIPARGKPASRMVLEDRR